MCVFSRCIAVFAICWFSMLTAQELPTLSLSVGATGIDDEESAVDYRVEYRASRINGGIAPILGIQFSSLKSRYAFFGFGWDWLFNNKFLMFPSLAVGAYHRGKGKNLGGLVEFRSGFEVAYRLSQRTRISLAIHHLSNSSIYRYNPGMESVVFTYIFHFK